MLRRFYPFLTFSRRHAVPCFLLYCLAATLRMLARGVSLRRARDLFIDLHTLWFKCVLIAQDKLVGTLEDVELLLRVEYDLVAVRPSEIQGLKVGVESENHINSPTRRSRSDRSIFLPCRYTLWMMSRALSLFSFGMCQKHYEKLVPRPIHLTCRPNASCAS